MQPMFTIQSSASSSFTSGALILRRSRGLSLVVTVISTDLIQSGMCFGASFWKKDLP